MNKDRKGEREKLLHQMSIYEYKCQIILKESMIYSMCKKRRGNKCYL